MSNNVAQTLPLTSYGDLRVAELTPVVQLIFNYTVDNTALTTNTIVAGGTVTQSDAMAVLSTSTTTSSSALLESFYHARYRAGMGGLCRFTTIFTTGVADTEQYIGILDETGSTAAFKNGLAVGYDGATFGFHRFQDDSKTTIAQSNFDDPLDGTGDSGITLDQTKLNVWAISFKYLGGGAMMLWIEGDNGEFYKVHTIDYSNQNTVPSVYNPNYHLTMYASNGSTTTDIVCKSASMSYFVEGIDRYFNIQQPLFSSGTVQATTVTTEVPVFTIRSKSTYASKTNFIDSVLELFTASIEASSANNLGTVKLLLNTTLGGTPSWSDINASDSTVEVDTAATSVSGGTELGSFALAGKNDSINIKLHELEIFLHEGDSITVTATSANSATVEAALLWRELF